MRVVRPIIIGALAGLALALSAMAGLYVSPLRQDLYFAADPGLAEARSRLETYQEWLGQADARIALRSPEADSLRDEQAQAWRDYKAWRSRLGDLARAHAQPSGSGFLRWAYSLRYWDGPAAAIVAFLCAAFAYLRARNRYRPARTRPGRAARAAAPARTQVPARAMAAEPPPTDLLPVVTEAVDAPGPAAKEPETVPLPQEALSEPPPGEDGRATRFLQVGPGWGLPPEDSPSGSPGLSMEDEDAAEPSNSQVTPGVMPPTTEVERVERRKEEVLRLARKGMTSSEISRRLRISQDQVEFIIRLRREKG